MTERIHEDLEAELRRGEGAHVEFKSPALDMTEAGPGMAKVLRAMIAFSSTPGDEGSQIYLGVVEGKKRRDLHVAALRAVERRRKLEGRDPLTETEVNAWKSWVDEASFISDESTHVVVLNRAEKLGPKIDPFTEQLKEFVEFVPPQGQVKLKRMRSSCRTPDPDGVDAQWVMRISLPPAGPEPHQARALRDMGETGGVRLNRSYVRYNASNDEVSPPLAKEFGTLRQSRRQTVPRLKRSLLAVTLIGLAAAALLLDRSPSFFNTPQLVHRLADGVEVDVKWSDIKAVDVERQGGGANLMDPEVMERNEHLWRVRTAIQNRIYRSGSVDTTTPRIDAEVGTVEAGDKGEEVDVQDAAASADGEPDAKGQESGSDFDMQEMIVWFMTSNSRTKDTGDGRLRLTLTPYGHTAPWVLHGRGFLREHKRNGEDNNEMWGAWLTAEPLDSLEDGARASLDLQLFSCVDQDKNDLTLSFDVDIDSERIWRPTEDDVEYFKEQNPAGESKTRVYVDPEDLGLHGPPVHVVTITWTRANE